MLAAFLFTLCTTAEVDSCVFLQLFRGLGPSHCSRSGEVCGGENQRRGRQRVPLTPRTLPGSSGADAQAEGARLPGRTHAG